MNPVSKKIVNRLRNLSEREITLLFVFNLLLMALWIFLLMTNAVSYSTMNLISIPFGSTVGLSSGILMNQKTEFND